jgi:phenylacetate-CoA ligase
MVTVRGVNVFPSAVENIIRRYKEVDEFRVTVRTVRHMDEMNVELEFVDGADPRLADSISQSLNSALSFRPSINVVEHNTLPRFELKAKRFHVKRE